MREGGRKRRVKRVCGRDKEVKRLRKGRQVKEIDEGGKEYGREYDTAHHTTAHTHTPNTNSTLRHSTRTS